ncbi:hypothetical protein MASR1M60_22790 [Rhodocyclaceae bacterium]
MFLPSPIRQAVLRDCADDIKQIPVVLRHASLNDPHAAPGITARRAGFCADSYSPPTD